MINRRHLLDASALLALIQNEAGADKVATVLDDSHIHGVNLAEVARKLVQKGMSVPEASALLGDLHLDVIDELNEKQAYTTANWVWQGLSLGDSVCLSIAHAHDLVIITADRSWSTLENCTRRVIQIRS